jgi:hypothetical protein
MIDELDDMTAVAIVLPLPLFIVGLGMISPTIAFATLIGLGCGILVALASYYNDNVKEVRVLELAQKTVYEHNETISRYNTYPIEELVILYFNDKIKIKEIKEDKRSLVQKKIDSIQQEIEMCIQGV